MHSFRRIQITFIAGIVVDAGDIANGAGKHAQVVGLQRVSRFAKFVYMGEIVYAVGLTLTKCSILFLYLRIFGINRRLRRIAYGLLGIAVSWGISLTTGAIFQYKPIAAAYNPLISQKTCIKVRDYFVVTSILNVLIDVAILVLPLPLLWQLQLSTSRKLTLSVIFTLGIFTTAISITRTVTLFSISEADITWDFVPLILYSTLESNTGFICSCLPVMAPLLHLVMGDRQGPAQERLGGLKEYRPPNLQKRSKYAAHVTEGFSILREDSPKPPAGCGHDVYTGAREHENEVYAEARGHELDEIGKNGQIHVTHNIDVER
ncbi:MAG: hypothetical protein ASARMPREDX12_001423 [Alectoria sarmentosa]|nr:MAG: hypothetical protein ASARMPREDX12_001423 [Alectoria sarmentosa]